MNADPKQENTEDVAEQLAQANERIAQMSQEAGDLKLDRQLLQKLAATGTVDLEGALLLAKARLEEGGDIDRAVEQLKVEKRYLFAGGSEKVTPRKTAGARERVGSKSTLLEQAAKKAARTGSRTDLLEYLRLRRSAP
jgi:hypothetical protein